MRAGENMEHERMRFRTMSVTELYMRLKKITHVDKLERFIMVAEEYANSNSRYEDLQRQAKRRLASILGRPQPPKVEQIPEKEIAKMIKPVGEFTKRIPKPKDDPEELPRPVATKTVKPMQSEPVKKFTPRSLEF